MTLRRKLLLYLAAIHVPFVAAAVYLLRAHTLWLLVVEVAFVVSILYGTSLVRGLFAAIGRIQAGTSFLADADFTSRFRPTGHLEMDRLVAVYNEMADRLREERTRNQEQNFFLEKILDASPVGLVTFDYDGRVSSLSPGAERLLGIPAARAVGSALDALDDANAAAVREVGPGEARVVTLTGNRRVKCARGEFMDRGFARAFVMLSEVTEDLRRSEKAAYEKLIRMMSHEVNNTVAASASILRAFLAYEPSLAEDEREDYVAGLSAVIDRTDKLNEFMRGFADVVRIPEPKLAPCDVGAVLDHVVRLMRADADARGVTLTREDSGELGPVALDRIQIEQVFVNIVKNALEAAGADGTVVVRLGTVGGRETCVVENSGPGIAPDVAERLFTPFFTTKPNGQGIGLTIVQEILARHGFTFSLESRPNEPTRFTIVFDAPHRIGSDRADFEWMYGGRQEVGEPAPDGGITRDPGGASESASERNPGNVVAERDEPA